MDKALFRAYVKELVKETVEDEVRKILPQVLAEAVAEVRSLQETTVAPTPKSKISRAQLAQMMGLERMGDTITATTKNVGPVMPNIPPGMKEDNPAVQAINKDYSQVMKAMGLSK